MNTTRLNRSVGLFPRLLFLSVFLAQLPACSTDTSGDLAARLERARAHDESGNLTAAVIELKSAVQLNPESAQARFELGRHHLLFNDGKGARKELERAIELGAPRAEAEPLLVEALLLLGQADAARDLAGTLAAGSEDPDLKLLLSRAELRAGNLDEAQVINEAVLQSEPDSRDAILGMARISFFQRDYPTAVALLDQVLENVPDDAEAALLRGQIEIRRGETEAALPYFDIARSSTRHELDGYLGEARALLALERYDALDDLLAVLSGKWPNLLAVPLFRGLANFGEGDYEQARDEFRTVLSKIPSHQTALLYAGLTAEKLGQLEQAEDYLKTVLNASPGNQNLRKLVASIQLRRRSYESVLETLDEGDGSLEDDALAAALEGTAMLNSGRVDSGLEALSRAKSLAPDDESVSTQLVIGQIAAGEFEAAFDLLNAQVEIGEFSLNESMLNIYALLAKQNWDKALAESQISVSKDDSNPWVFNALGLSLIGKEQFSEARDAFAKGLEIDPHNIPLIQNLLLLDSRLGRTEDFETRYQELMDRDPDNPITLALIGDVARAAGREREALLLMERARRLDSRLLAPRIGLGSMYLERKEYQRALVVSREAVGIETDNLMAMVNLGGALIGLGRPEIAEEIADKVVDLYPDSPLAAFYAGNVNLANSKLDRAEQELTRALQLLPEYEGPLVALARLAAKRGNAGEATRLLDEIERVRGGEDEAGVSRLRGDVAFSLGDREGAVRHYVAALSHSHAHSDAVKVHQLRFENGDAAEAIAGTVAVLENQPDNVALRMLLADSYRATGDSKRAIAEYERVLEASPDAAVALNNLALLKQDIGEFDAALALAKKADEINPNNPVILDTLGWITAGQGQLEAGVGKLRRAYELAPGIGEIGVHYAETLLKVGRKQEAMDVLYKVVQLGEFSTRSTAENLLKNLMK